MSSFYLVNEIKNYSTDKIFEDMSALLDRTGRLLVLLDETLEADSFSELKSCLKEENIIYLPLAQGNKPKNTNLFFLEIKKKDVLEKVGKEIAKKISNNFEVQNDKYLVHGFGTSVLENNIINEKFKSSVVVQDLNSKILFRWYDPRVLNYLDQIFNEMELNSLLGLFEIWNFVHPIGYFSWEKKQDKKIISRKINKLSHDQSLALDLIEISNLVFRSAFEYDEIDRDKLNPKNILLNLFVAHEEYEVHKYSDLLSYGLYAEILGRHFFIHPQVENILEQYWNKTENEYDFNEAMNFLHKDQWVLIKNDLNDLESITHG